MTFPLWKLSASDLARAIRDKKVSSVEAIEAHLNRIEAVNAGLNAVVANLAEAALDAAHLADEQIASGADTGPLHGVPFTIKDVFDLAVTATTMGIVDLKDKMPATDAPVIAHLKRAGAIPIARTNVPDFGVRWHTDNDLHGATLNPWDAARTPGGSSGGEAVAIATGMSPLGIGGDMGGSLRFPAQCCGIVALKPGFGRISRTITSNFDDPPMFYEQVACVNGPMARHVGDLRLALDVLGAPDPNDPCWTPAPRNSGCAQSPVRVAVTTDPGGDGCCPIISAAISKAAAILSDAGYMVEETSPPCLDETTSIIERIANAETQSYLPDMLPMMSKAAGAYLQGLVEDTESDLPSYMNAIAARHRIAAEWRAFMQEFVLILGPVSSMPPFEVGYDLAGKEHLQKFVRSMTLTEACNLLGLPSVTLPVMVTNGLPQGVQLIAGRFAEYLCLDAAEVIEAAAGVFTPIEPCIQDQY
ncbi:MAG: hypothetical protein HKN11_02645 [Rhizobiales bacterium]|nr:hypothetical protein [Hyphomicrobiales bacterium]